MGEIDISSLSELLNCDVSLVQSIHSEASQADEFLSKVEESFCQFQSLKRNQINAENQICQLEKQLLSCNKKLEASLTDSTNLNSRLESAETKLVLQKEKLSEFEETISKSSEDLKQISSENQRLLHEKLSLVDIGARNSKELEGLQETVKGLTHKLKECSFEKNKLKNDLDELQAHQITTQFKEERLEQEKSNLQVQLNDFKLLLDSKVEEIKQMSHEKINQSASLAEKVQIQEIQISQLKVSEKKLKQIMEQQQEETSELSKSLNNVEKLNADSEGQFEKELCAKSKLIVLYKEEAEDKKQRLLQMNETIADLESSLNQSLEDKVSIQQQMDICQQRSETRTKDLEDQVKGYQLKLDEANIALDNVKAEGRKANLQAAMSELSPSAASTSAILKEGMNLTQIYGVYAESKDALLQEKGENKRLKGYLEQILTELSDKAPLLQQQKDNYQNALKTIDNLSQQLNSTINECQVVKKHKEEAEHHKSSLQREVNRLKTTCMDLGQQVKVLLKECEQARGGHVLDESGEEQSALSSDLVSSSSQVISSHLVTFRNIEELQAQNQRLLVVCRDLSEEKEEREADRTEERISSLKQELSRSKAQLGTLSEKSNNQGEMLETVVKQRDTYRSLYVSGASQSQADSTHSSFTSEQSMSVQEADDLKERLHKLEDMLNKSKLNCETTLEESKAKLQESRIELRKSEEKCFDLQRELKTHKSEMELLRSQLKVSERNAAHMKSEIAALEAKCFQFSKSSEDNQKKADHQSIQLTEAKDQIMKLEISLRGSDVEKKILKDVEQRLLLENKTLLVQQGGRDALLTNLQSIQNTLEHQSYESKAALERQLEKRENDFKAAKKVLEGESQKKTLLCHTLETELEVLKEKYSNDSNLLKVAKEELQQAKEEGVSALQLAKELQTKLSSIEQQLPAKEIGDILKEAEEQRLEAIKAVAAQLSDAKQEVEDLKERLESAQSHVQQYKEISNGTEDALQQLKKDNEEKVITLEKAVASAKEEAEQSAKDLSTLKKNYEKLEVTNEERVNYLTDKSEKAEQDVIQLTNDLQSARKDLEEAMVFKTAAANEVKENQEQLNETQEKYERELVQHAANVNKMLMLKSEYQEKMALADENKIALEQTTEQLRLAKEKSSELEKHQEKERAKLTSRCQELTNQNSVLHQEIEKLTTRMASSSAMTMPAVVPDDVKHSIATSSGEDLYEVIRFIRREKEISEMAKEAAVTENLRFKQRCSHYENEYESTKKALALERERTKGQMLTMEEHNDLLSKVEQYGVLQNEMKTLEANKSKVDRTNKLLIERVKKTEIEISALKEAKRQFENEKGAWTTEKTALKAEIDRWSSRASQLIEQKGKADNEEVKSLQRSRANLEKSTNLLREENGRLKTQLEGINRETLRIRTELSESQAKAKTAQTQIDAAKMERETMTNRLNEEMDNLKKAGEQQQNELTEKLKAITELKRIARKYKLRCAELEKEKEEAAIKSVSEAAANTPSTSVTEEMKRLQEQNNDLQASKDAAEQNVTVLQDQVNTLTADLNAGKETIANKERQHKDLFEKAKIRVKSLKAMKDRLAKEKDEKEHELSSAKQTINEKDQKEQEYEMRLNALKSQFEGKINKLEEELKSTAESSPKKVMPSTGIQATKKRPTVKSIGSKQSLPVEPKSKRLHTLTQAITTTESHQAAPLTATVRPSATSAASLTTKTTCTPTASIRPLSVATPTAMVSPTVPMNPAVPSTSRSTDTHRGQSGFKAPLGRASPQIQMREDTPASISDRDDSSTGDESGSQSQSQEEAVAPVESHPMAIVVVVADERGPVPPLSAREPDAEALPSTQPLSPSTSSSHDQATKRLRPSAEEEQHTRTNLEDQPVFADDPFPHKKKMRVDVIVDVPALEEVHVNEATENQELDNASPPADTPMTDAAGDEQPQVDVDNQPSTVAGQDNTNRNVATSSRQFRSRYQVPSFSLPPGQSGNAPFEDADDCTVPSTPTLFLPKRNDGFAEAVSSPQVRNPVFSFGTQPETSSSGLLRLDDTRVDLMAADESSNVPDLIETSRDTLIPIMAPSVSLVEIDLGSISTQEQNVPQQIDLTEEEDLDNEEEVIEVGNIEDDDDDSPSLGPTVTVSDDEDGDDNYDEGDENDSNENTASGIDNAIDDNEAGDIGNEENMIDSGTEAEPDDEVTNVAPGNQEDADHDESDNSNEDCVEMVAHGDKQDGNDEIVIADADIDVVDEECLEEGEIKSSAEMSDEESKTQSIANTEQLQQRTGIMHAGGPTMASRLRGRGSVAVQRPRIRRTGLAAGRLGNRTKKDGPSDSNT